MKNLYIFLLLILLYPSFSSAQSNYKAGYIVTLKGDTLPGFIDYKEWNNTPDKVNFKSGANSMAQIYTPKNSNGFGVKGFDNYQTYIGKISQDRIELSKLRQTIDSTYIVDTVFLRIIVKGKNITLLNYTDDIKDRYFVSEKNGQPDELIYHAYLSNNEKRVTEAFDTRYKKQLQILRTIYLSNDNELINAIQTTPYTEKGILKIIDKLNEETIATQTTAASRTKTRFFAGIGASKSTSYFDIPQLGPSPTYIAPMVTGGIDFILNKNTGKLIFRTELSFTANQVRSFNNDIHSIYYDTHLNYDQKNISFVPQFLYNFYNPSKLKLYLGLGMSINYAIYSNKEYYIKNNFGNSNLNFPSTLTPTMYFDFVTKLGVVLSQKFDIHFNYLPTYTTAISKINSYQAGVNYLF